MNLMKINHTPADVKTDEAGDAGASPVSGTNLYK